MLEGVAHAMSWAIQTLAAENPLSTITAIGGGTRNPVWVQAVSDICGLPQTVVSSPGACVGSAYLAGCAAGLTLWAQAWAPEVSHTVEPRRDYQELYAGDQDRFRDLYHVLAASRGTPRASDPPFETPRTIR
jgi:xylulokinase